MKNLMYFLKRRNQVSFLLVVAFVIVSFSCPGQGAPQRLFAKLTLLKVAEGKERAFETYVAETVKPLQNLRKQKGEIVLWILFKVHFSGQANEYNYIGVGYYPAWANTEEPESLVDLYRQLYPEGDVAAFQARQRELRTVIGEHVYFQLEAIEPNPPVPSKYVRLDYMKTKPGKGADYLKAEREDWMPFHRTLVNDGQSTGWGLWQVVFPGGTGMPYDYVTSNRYATYAHVLATDFEKTFKKASPSKNVNDVFNRTTQSRDLVKSELWEVVEILN